MPQRNLSFSQHPEERASLGTRTSILHTHCNEHGEIARISNTVVHRNFNAIQKLILTCSDAELPCPHTSIGTSPREYLDMETILQECFCGNETRRLSADDSNAQTPLGKGPRSSCEMVGILACSSFYELLCSPVYS